MALDIFDVNLLPNGKEQSLSHARLHGVRLHLARAAWVLLVSLALGLFIIGLPARFEELVNLSVQARNTLHSLPPAQQQALLVLERSLDFYAAGILGLEVAVVAAFSLTGVVIVWRKWDDRMALFVSLAHITYAVYISPALDALMLAQPAWQSLTNFVQAVGLGCANLFIYLLPDGRLTTRWMRLLAALWLAFTMAWGLFPAVPFNLARPFDVPLVWFLTLMGWWFSALFVQAYRYRNAASPVQRQQTKWVIICLAGGILAYAVVYLVGAILAALPQRVIANLLYDLFGVPIFLLLLLPIPTAISLSVHRYHLFDVETALNRTLVYGALTALLVAIYIGSVVALQALFVAVTPLGGAWAGGNTSPVVVAFSTLATAALFTPLRCRVQDIIDRNLFRDKYDAVRTLAGFSARIRDEVDLARLVECMEGVVTATVQPAHVLTWLRTPSGYGLHLFEIDALPKGDVNVRPANVEVAVGDPLVDYFRTAPGAVGLNQLKLDSPALSRLLSANVAIAVPMISQGELIGWLSLGPRLGGQGYSADDKGLLSNLAAQAAPVVRVAQLVGQQRAQAVEHERLEQELRVARLIQETLLPKQLPSLSGWGIAAYWQPARAVGGDFYDFWEFGDGRLGIVTGDVAGKGMPAALVMAATRSLLYCTARSGRRTPGEVLQRVNDLLHPDLPAGTFVTCLYAILNPATGHLRYANAGHNVPYRCNSGGTTELKAAGMPLGLMPGMVYLEQETTLLTGDSLLLYSDGLVEARNPQREMFGFPRLQAFLTQSSSCGAELLKDLLDELRRFVGPEEEPDDDLTLVMLQRLPAPDTNLASSVLM